MAIFTSNTICPADLYRSSNQAETVDSYNIKQLSLSPVALERESSSDSRHRSNSADISTQGGSSVNLRTASYKPKKPTKWLTKNLAYKKLTSLERLTQPRQSHNLVEKRYRSKLKSHFESLLAVLPVPPSKDDHDQKSCNRCFTRAEVLVAARDRIISLEEGLEVMAKERDQLQADVALIDEFTH
ncbi:uncharacterized protein FTOL_10133 [Fusarium torulosum]|uniref:BHLH domain-containing protein n=1 Tax=Fusarium torulosum TaxID=33205 RepID=A0AAE8SLR7_9HYPO|nr:uncharacterized protein FTOL_10133 [Fusarium torulosum]